MALQERDTSESQKTFINSSKVSTGVSSGEMSRTSTAVVTFVQRTKVPQTSLVPSFSSWRWGPLWRRWRWT